MTKVKTSKKLLWIDLEMTGLDPAKHRIVEVAAIITDFDFNELASYEAVVKQSAVALENMEAWSRNQHTKSGLLAKIPKGLAESKVEQELVKLVDDHFKDPVTLAGNSIHWDRRFIRTHWPKLEAKLHYRMLDVTSWKIIMQNKFNLSSEKDAHKPHRSLDDIRNSIEELKSYLDYFHRSKNE